MSATLAPHDDISAATQSFHDLLLAALPSLRAQALSLTRHRADAEDLVQQAVTNALSGKDSYEPGTNFRAWMTRILRNRFFSNFRRRREMVDISEVPSSMMGRSGGQEESLELKELRRYMGRLPADQRLILMMISVECLSYDEASEQLGVAVGTLKCRVFRARRQLREWMLGEEKATIATSETKQPRSRSRAANAPRDEGLRLS